MVLLLDPASCGPMGIERAKHIRLGRQRNEHQNRYQDKVLYHTKEESRDSEWSSTYLV